MQALITKRRQPISSAATSEPIRNLKGISMNSNQSFFSRQRAFGIVAASALAIGNLFGGVAQAADATSSATAKVVTPITVSNTAALAFGSFSAGSGGTILIGTDGARSKTAGVVLLNSSTGAAAAFAVNGENNTTYTISLPTTVSVSDGTNTMSLGSFVSNPSGTGTLSGSGAQTINVGATLTVASSQAAGNYTGSFNVSVEYN
jgi:hypothetical protein